jgi:hypothetical protein
MHVSGMTTKKTFSQKQWKAMKVVSKPTGDRGMIKEDASGHRWEYVTHIQNVYVKPA